jgi:hypothetical protein
MLLPTQTWGFSWGYDGICTVSLAFSRVFIGFSCRFLMGHVADMQHECHQSIGSPVYRRWDILLKWLVYNGISGISYENGCFIMGQPSGKRLHSELERSTIFDWKILSISTGPFSIAN